MPELPEVETVRRGLAPHLIGQTVIRVIVRQPRLRWVIPAELATQLPGQVIQQVERRAKYLLLYTETGVVILHLGMSGRLRLLPSDISPQKHDHADLVLGNGYCLRLNDSRRFGALLWTKEPLEEHPLLRILGLEPFDREFSGEYLYQRAQGRSVAVKNFIMNGRIVVGVGNIYASESLFVAGIHPLRAAGKITGVEYERLVNAIHSVLEAAIRQGGTTLRDFADGNGKAGYFQQSLQVYGQTHLPCMMCGTAIQQCKIGQRASYFCPCCQPQ